MLPAVFQRLTVRPVVIGLAVAVVVAAPACRKAASNATPPPRVTACSLLSADDVSAGLGAPVGAPEPTADAGADALAGRSGCAWTTVDQRRAVLIELVRTKDMSGSVRRTGFSASARFASVRSRHADAATVPAVGPNAIWIDETATLHVLADDSYLTFEVAVPVPSEARGVGTTLAQGAVKRLGTPGNQAN
jgi:hypothetical protein